MKKGGPLVICSDINKGLNMIRQPLIIGSNETKLGELFGLFR